MKALHNFHRVLLKLEDAFLLFLVAAIILLPVMQILSRLLEWQGLLWTNQAARLDVLWLSLTGAMIASRQQQHIRIDLLQHFKTAGWYKWVQRFSHFCTASICAVIAWFCSGLVKQDYIYGSSAFLDLPLWICEMIIPLAFSVIALRFSVAIFIPHVEPDPRSPAL
jgi:TRAP-type C4-dicarboxylate transport system permease small subunit